MPMKLQEGGEDSLAIRAAWLHYAGGMTQAAVAKKLGVASVKAHRLISRANQAGAVKVTIDGEIAECVALEDQLSRKYSLSYCEVAPDLMEDGLPLRALGVAGAGFLKRELGARNVKLLGLGHGRTLSAMVGQLPTMDVGETQLVSLLGGLSRNFATNPHDVVHRLAAKTGAKAYFMPVPFFANSVGDRKVLLAQRGVQDVVDMGGDAELKLVGIGTAEQEAPFVATGMIDLEEISDVKNKGGVGELLGHFFDAEGNAIETILSARTMSVGLEGIAGSRVIAVSGGEEKIGAIRSVLKSGYLSGLITDERTASALVNDD